MLSDQSLSQNRLITVIKGKMEFRFAFYVAIIVEHYDKANDEVINHPPLPKIV